jgi:hypothetical protein
MLQPFSLNKNLVPRFARGGGHKKAMKDALVVEEGGYQDSLKEENFSITHVTFPFVRA